MRREDDKRGARAKLIEAFGRSLLAAFEGWKFYVLTADTDFERSFGRKADKKRKLYNGMIKCDLTCTCELREEDMANEIGMDNGIFGETWIAIS